MFHRLSHHTSRLGLIAALLLVPIGGWGIPLQINEQGVVQVGDEPFEGTGVFRFALVEAASGTNLWTNDASQLGGTGVPTSGVPLPVVSGIYHVRLGDDALSNMTPIGPEVFDPDLVLLKIWFDDGVNGVQPLSPNAGLTSVPYAYRSLVTEFAFDADTVDGAHASELEESVEIDADIGIHDTDPDAHPNIELDGARIVSGKIDNTRLNMGEGGGLNADGIDGLDSTQFLRSDLDDTTLGTLLIAGPGKKLISRATVSDESAENVSKIEVQNSMGVAVFFVDEDGDLVAVSLSGEGSQLTNLDGDNIAQGIVGESFIDAAIARDSEIDTDVSTHDSDPGAHPDIELDGDRITSGKIANDRLNTGAGAGLDADTVDGAHAASLEESVEIDADVDAHDTHANAHPNIQLDGARITSGKIANSRLNTGSGNGIDSDLVDGLQGAQFLRSDVDDLALGTLTLQGTAKKLAIRATESDESTGNVRKLEVQDSDGSPVFSVDEDGDVAATSFTGDGSGLSNVIGTNISTGTVADSRIASTIHRDDELKLVQNVGVPGTTLNESTSPNDSGASLIGVFDELVHTNATNLQDALDDMDAAITGASGLQGLFETVDVPGGTDPEADDPNDTLVLLNGPGMDIVGDLTDDSITIGVLADGIDGEELADFFSLDNDLTLSGPFNVAIENSQDSGQFLLDFSSDSPAANQKFFAISKGTSSPTEIFSVDEDGDVAGASFSGDGSGLTSLNGTQITTGTVADARIASTLARDTEVTSAVDTHNGDAGAHPNIELDGDRITSGKIDNARLNTGAGNGFDSDLLDGLQSSQFLRSDEDDTTTGTLTVEGDGEKLVSLSTAADESTGDVSKLEVQDSAASPVFTVDEDGDVVALSFSGDGLNLTDLDGSEITTGIVADARIAATLARDSEVTSAVDTHNSDAGAHPNIELNGDRITSGKIDNARLNTGAGNGFDSDLLDGIQASQFLRSDEDDTTTGTLSVVGTSEKLLSRATTDDETAGDVSKLEVQNSGSSAVFSVDEDGDVIAASFSGDGSDLTGLNGSEVTTGTVADARIASSIARDIEVTAAVGTHNNDAGAHPNIELNGDRITSGKISNARLNTGEGNGLDADTVDGKHASNLQDKFVRIVVVSPVEGGSSTDNGTALLNALGAITNNSATNPYLVKIEPGIYDLGSQTFNMKTFVDVEGSGEKVTTLTSTGADTVLLTGNCALRDLTVINTGTGAKNGVGTTSSFVCIERVTVSMTNNGSYRGIRLLGGGSLRHVTVSISGSGRMVGGVKCSGGDTTLHAVRIDCDTALAKGIVLDGASSVKVHSCDIDLSAGDSIAIESLADTTIEVYSCILVGGTSIDLSGTTGLFASTHFIGARSGSSITYAQCLTNSTFTPITDTLASIP